MHKGCILLTKAVNQKDAINKVNKFMKRYGNGRVWDWFVVGGCWSGMLGMAQLDKAAKEEFWKEFEELGLDGTDNENPEEKQRERAYDLFWKHFPEWPKNKSLPIYRDAYATRDYVYSVMPLKKCLPAVKEWQQSEQDIETALKERPMSIYATISSEKRPEPSGDDARKIRDSAYKRFSRAFNIYDIDEHMPFAPEEIKGYYAVVVDMHN